LIDQIYLDRLNLRVSSSAYIRSSYRSIRIAFAMRNKRYVLKSGSFIRSPNVRSHSLLVLLLSSNNEIMK